ncbi:MAG: mechanosensitive ion channel family protein [Flavobacteriales bacterium]|jgi:miniconductance mechanosensitive channel|uniref:mechanosensitive ion channel family protein n=1 Tax=Blattabacterium sp. (Mastotermes darwiniensis) TaxID=39768 RepID=UPI000231DF49|nr:mechanosensitive ion channel domain-containing protein [Blattabacterium sp. (Mastotermes darwiniensis)]AER40869.1 MscS Mechanosensitive ion channel [Blattabacterium sp. (Mastotermes darwiniensis) str. MADAR]MDR1804716.1 mechanosensitive ion channel family protein [Flavobacteriales bacterium]
MEILLNEWIYEFIPHLEFFKKWINTTVIIIGKILLFITVLIIFEFIFHRVVCLIVRKIVSSTPFVWDNILYENKVFASLAHFFPLSIGFILVDPFFKYYPKIILYIEKIFYILLVLILLQFLIGIVNSIMRIVTNEKNHPTIAIRSFSQLLKIISFIFCFLIIIAILTKNDLTTVLTSLGTITAIFMLVFRDTILGFVSVVQMASTKMIKVGDWIGIQKYSIEGTVIEINLISAKIENFDRTITSIPTYDLISTSVINFEVMRKKNIRRIKRSILFNIHSFHFCDSDNLKKFQHFSLIKNYIHSQQKEIEIFNIEKNMDPSIDMINGRPLTNIGIFRQYALAYLHEHPKISQSETLMVRYLEPTPYGLPIELYCFTNTSDSIKYEQIQANIFDHLLTAAKAFNLKVTQITNKKW